MRLHFAEPRLNQPGQRIFDVLLQGTPALEDFDLFRATGGANRSVVHQFEVDVNGTLTVALHDSVASNAAPFILCLEVLSIF